MTALQKINQGTAPAGSDGDTVRSAFSKVNSNVDVLNTQAALTSSAVITAAQALTNAYVGKRVNINLTSAGTINMPAASTCAADQVTLLRNIGTTVATLAIATGSGDTVSLSKLNPGETALMDTDGIHAWNVLMRGRTNSDNESVSGSLNVTGNASVGGTLGVSGASTFSMRPTFAGKTPWDSGNLNPGLILLETQGPTGVANVFKNLSGFNVYELVFDGLVPVLDNTPLGVHLSNNNGNTWIISAQYERTISYHSTQTSGVAVAGQTAQTLMTMWDGMSNVAGNPAFATYSGSVRFHNFTDVTKIPSILFDVNGVDRSNNSLGHVSGVGRLLALSGNPINALRIFGGGSGFSAGRLSLYGMNY